ncbi:MAG: lysine--tRNA ligase [Halobacteriota archaeon]
MENHPTHWADVIARAVNGPQVIATGITPSGNIHIGNLREVVTGDAILRAIASIGGKGNLIFVADTFDPLRTVYPFLPATCKKYVGVPLSEIPDPFGCCVSYAEHYLAPFLESLDELGIVPEVYRADLMYKTGRYSAAIATALEHRDSIAHIIETVSGRKLPPQWSPFSPLCGQCGRISSAEILRHMPENTCVQYRCQCGAEGLANYSRGEGKLAWRVDWPARWKILSVTIEPFGKDHAVAGGSYDTGKLISKQVYHYDPPRPVPYGHIHLKGQGKMSSSKGITVTIREMLEVVPADVLRFMIIKTKPEKLIDFDPGLGLLTLIDEFDHGHGRAAELSKVSAQTSSVPFRHMVTAVQIAPNLDELVQVLRRSGYTPGNINELQKRSQNVRNWLDQFAPSFVKFEVQETLPVQAKTLTKGQKQALLKLANALKLDNNDPEWLHNEVYDVSARLGIDAKSAFKAIYIALLGKNSGPRAGWFLASLDPEFVVSRFEEAGSA